MLRFYRDGANACTLLGFIAGFSALWFLFEGRPYLALAFILLGAIADVFDGPLARAAQGRLEKASEFGQSLDTLADMCHSVLAPALFVAIIQDFNIWGAVSGLVLAIAGTTRLAYFSAIGSDKPGFFVGVPVTYVPLSLGLVANLVPEKAHPMIWIAFGVAMAGLQIGKFQFPKYTGKALGVFALVLTALCAISFARGLSIRVF
ncbi:hypothetical protein G6L09_22325 [Agrobacterium rhizogenes]|nr:hypothetical protein [Rhizobium rhizogenes]NTH73306.1 hypothetical protein [Rhizobium rhizogenes]